jgi:hypothetical protein
VLGIYPSIQTSNTNEFRPLILIGAGIIVIGIGIGIGLIFQQSVTFYSASVPSTVDKDEAYASAAFTYNGSLEDVGQVYASIGTLASIYPCSPYEWLNVDRRERSLLYEGCCVHKSIFFQSNWHS